jgi:thiamine biosynthesis lipoprotein
MPRGALRTEPMWGTVITVDVRQSVDDRTIDDVYQWFRRVDDLFSTWRSDSEISRLARGELALGHTSMEVRAVLRLCDEVMEESRGAFDIRVGADPRVTRREGLGLIDPSGMVKGWALQRAADHLREQSVLNFAINAGGDVLVGGCPAVGELWRVGIQHPWDRQKLAAVVELTDAIVATSGRYERGDHIIDPITGQPATGLAAVTVISGDGARADAYATAALAMGPSGAAWLAERHDLAALTIGDDRIVTTTATFDHFRAKHSEGCQPVDR